MGIEDEELNAADGPLEREAMRARLARDFGIDSAFIRVSELARLLSLSDTSIYTSMRRGDFPIPHRKVGSSLMVKVDDFLDWYIGGARHAGSLSAALSPADGSGAARCDGVAQPKTRAAAADAAARTFETPSERAARIKREVLEEMVAARRSSKR